MSSSPTPQPDKTQDRYRLDWLPTYLNAVKQGTDADRLAAIVAVETTLLRIHSPYAIAWDFGGVLMDGHNRFFIELYARSKGASLRQDQLINLWQTIFKSDPVPGVNYDALKIGQATPEQFATHAIEAFNANFAAAGYAPIEIDHHEIQRFLTLYYSHYDPKHENRTILERIHRIGIRQYGLTNNFMAKVEYFLGQPEFDYLQNLIPIVSEKFGASKPDPKIYRMFRQHVLLDCFAQTVLQVKFPNPVIEQLWQAIFQPTAHCADESSPDGSQVIAHYNQSLLAIGHSPVDATAAAAAWAAFWRDRSHQIGTQTIFVDDKVSNLKQAFHCEGILGVHYDANQGQALHKQPVLRELLDQAELTQAIRLLRELTVLPDGVGQRAQQSLQRLMPLRVRHERQGLSDRSTPQSAAVVQGVADSLTDSDLYELLQTHYNELYAVHFKQGQLVSQQYALVHRLASLPMYSYDDARQIVLELFETSDLLLDQNHSRYLTHSESEVPESWSDLKDAAAAESLLQRMLLPELINAIVSYVDTIGVAHQPNIQSTLHRLQTEVTEVEALKRVLDQLLHQLADLRSLWAVPYAQVQAWIDTLRQLPDATSSHEELQTALMHHLQTGADQLQHNAQQAPLNLLPLPQMLSDWETKIHGLECSYLRQYSEWKTLKDQYKRSLCQDDRLQVLCRTVSEEALYQYVRDLTLRLYDLPYWKDLARPTIVLVGGASGSGKSTLSAQLAQSLGIQKLFSTDETGRANLRALLDYLFEAEAQSTYPALYQSSFEGSLASYYCQSLLTIVGVEGLMQRLETQNSSAIIEGVVLIPGLLTESTFASLNLDWLIIQLDADRHWQHFTARGQAASQRHAERYQANFDTIRQIHDRIVHLGLVHGLTILENNSPIQHAVRMAIERIQAPTTDAFHPVRDPLREEVAELLEIQQRHLPLKIDFDVERTAIDMHLTAETIRSLLHRFGFEPVADRRHQWIRQPLREVPRL
jgi:2-phosphoglycerate kinase/FMN phosphatase YigB (HAD superfamily)